MRTVRPWTREDRRHLAEELAPRLVDWFGDRLLALALLNERPYTTFARFVTEARHLPCRPARFGELLDLFVDGRLGDTATLQERILDVVRVEALVAIAGPA